MESAAIQKGIIKEMEENKNKRKKMNDKNKKNNIKINLPLKTEQKNI